MLRIDVDPESLGGLSSSVYTLLDNHLLPYHGHNLPKREFLLIRFTRLTMLLIKNSSAGTHAFVPHYPAQLGVLSPVCELCNA